MADSSRGKPEALRLLLGGPPGRRAARGRERRAVLLVNAREGPDMTKPWRSRRKKISVAAALATVLVASGVGLVRPSSALAADTPTDTSATPTEPGDVTRHDWASDEHYFHNPHRDASYVRFRVCPKTDNATTGTSATPDAVGVAGAGTTTTTTTTSTGTAAASSPTDATTTTSTATRGPNDDVIAGDPVFVLLPIKKERAKDYRRPEQRRELCYDLNEQQLVNADDPTAATTTTANAETGPTVTDPTTPITPTPTSTAPATGG
jgi:hypothetical protein